MQLTFLRRFLYLDEERFPRESPFPKQLRESIGENLIAVTGNEDKLEVSKFCANYLEDTKKQKELEHVLEPDFTVIHRGGNFMEIAERV